MKPGDVVEYTDHTGAITKVQIIQIIGDKVDIGPLSNPWGTLITVPIERIKKVDS